MKGLPVTAEEVEIMTCLHRQIRSLTDRVADRRGRPILLALRGPDNLEMCMNIGLDVKTWLEEDLVDILIAGGGYAPFTMPLEQWTELAHQYDVPVYPCVNRQVSDCSVTEGIRAVTANWYRAGADGIYFWNLGTPCEYKTGQELLDIRQRYYSCLCEVGDPSLLIGKDKLFCVDGPVWSPYTHVSSLPPLPVSLNEDTVQQVPLVVGDDLEVARNSGYCARLGLRLILEGQVSSEALQVRFNGELLTDGRYIDGGIVDFSLLESQVKPGKNIIEASLGNTAGKVQLLGIQLKLEYQTDK